MRSGGTIAESQPDIDSINTNLGWCGCLCAYFSDWQIDAVQADVSNRKKSIMQKESRIVNFKKRNALTYEKNTFARGISLSTASY